MVGWHIASHETTPYVKDWQSLRDLSLGPPPVAMVAFSVLRLKATTSGHLLDLSTLRQLSSLLAVTSGFGRVHRRL